METLTVNLQPEEGNDRYLQIGITFKSFDKHAEEQIKTYTPELRSKVLMLLAICGALTFVEPQRIDHRQQVQLRAEARQGAACRTVGRQAIGIDERKVNTGGKGQGIQGGFRGARLGSRLEFLADSLEDVFAQFNDFLGQLDLAICRIQLGGRLAGQQDAHRAVSGRWQGQAGQGNR
ncbi:flagellar basal body-associated FliL family protein [Ralstonia pickettii]|uniref:flagellar basal body-associated FliL family protein n=1 Tax=Ralstonia pickettii TaxID=329 RepID=UPI002155FC72